MSRHHAAQRWIRILIAGLCTVLFLCVTQPAHLPAVLLLVPFGGMFVFLYLTVMEVIRFLGPDEDENGAIIRMRRPRVLSAVLAGFPVLLLLLQSIVALTLWDVLITLTIVLLAYLYIARSSVSFWR